MLLTVIIFLLLLSVLVFVHELGHFYFARKFGVKVDEFGFGIPPRIFGIQFIKKNKEVKVTETKSVEVDYNKDGSVNKEIIDDKVVVTTKKRYQWVWGNKDLLTDSYATIYSLNWIPIGGFVKMKGEEGEFRDESNSFASKKIWQRMIILAAGVFMNAVLCAICLMVAFGIGAPASVETTAGAAAVRDVKIQIVSVLPNSAAEKAGIKMGDAILTLDNVKVETIEQVQNYVADHGGKDVSVQVDRYGTPMTITVKPMLLAETNKAGLGVSLAKTGIVSYPWYKSIWYGIVAAASMFVQIIVAFYNVIKNAIMGKSLGVDVAGPVGIAVLTGQMARMGFVYLLQFAALLSMNLAIINFLPFPALDGGRFWFLIVEKIRRKPINQKVEQWVHTVGFALLLLLAFLVTGRDIWKMFIK